MVDFSPLTQLKSHTPSKRMWGSGLGLAAAFFVCAGIADTLPPELTPIAGAFLLFLVICIGAIALTALFIWWHSTNQTNNKAYQAFAAANNFTYSPRSDVALNGSGTLFTHGDSKETSNVLSGKTSAGLPIDIFHYKYDTGSGRSRTTHYASVVRLTLPRKVPHMVIDSLVEDSAESVLPIQFDTSQQIKAEGDFNHYFALYAPDTYAVSLLSIIGPDVMWALMRHAAACDIEIIDNYIYFYWPFTARSAAEYQNMLATVDEIMKEIGRKLTTGNIYTTDSQAQLHSHATAQGARLKTGLPFASAIGVVAFAVYALHSLAPDAFGLPLTTLFVPFVITILAVTIVQAVRKQKRRQQLLQRFGIPSSGNK